MSEKIFSRSFSILCINIHMGIRTVLNDGLVNATIKNYIDRAIETEVEQKYINTREEYEIVYPIFEDLPIELREWLIDNNIDVGFYYNERICDWLEFENEQDSILFKMRWD